MPRFLCGRYSSAGLPPIWPALSKEQSADFAGIDPPASHVSHAGRAQPQRRAIPRRPGERPAADPPYYRSRGTAPPPDIVRKVSDCVPAFSGAGPSNAIDLRRTARVPVVKPTRSFLPGAIGVPRRWTVARRWLPPLAIGACVVDLNTRYDVAERHPSGEVARPLRRPRCHTTRRPGGRLPFVPARS